MEITTTSETGERPGASAGSVPAESEARATRSRGRMTFEVIARRERNALAVMTLSSAPEDGCLDRLQIELDGRRATHVLRLDLDPACIVVVLPARPASRAAASDDSQPAVEPTAIALVVPGASSGGRWTGPEIGSLLVLPSEPSLPSGLWATFPGRVWRRMGLAGREPLRSDFPWSHFDGLGYLQANPDVAEAVIRGGISSALAHYRDFGRKRGRMLALASGRRPNMGNLADCFDGGAYLARYPDIAEAVRLEAMPSALEHYLRYGRREGRVAPLRFDQRASPGTAIELARLELSSTRAELRRAAASLSTLQARFAALHGNMSTLGTNLSALQKELAQVGYASRERMEQVQAQLVTLARARQAREKELLLRLETLGESNAPESSKRGSGAPIRLTEEAPQRLGSRPE